MPGFNARMFGFLTPARSTLLFLKDYCATWVADQTLFQTRTWLL